MSPAERGLSIVPVSIRTGSIPMPPPGQTAPPPKWPAQYNIPIVVQQRLDALLDPLLNPDGAHSDDPYGDAVKAAVAAFMETPRGKKLKDLILSRRVLPMTIM